MLRKNLLKLSSFTIVLIICCKLQGQNLENYNKIYNKTYLETSQNDFSKALFIADSLFQTSKTPKFQTKSLMLSATLHQQSGNIKKAVAYAQKAEKIAVDSDDFLWQSKIYGFLSSQYRNLGLYIQSKNYIDKSESIIKNLDSKLYADNMMGFIMQEKAYYEIQFKNYKKALSYIQKSQNYFNSAGNKEIFITANNKQLEGLCYLKLRNFTKALNSYKDAETALEDMPDNFLKGLIFNETAQVYIETKNLDLAKKYLDKAESISDQSNYINLKNEIYTTSQQYYMATQNIKKLTEVTKKHDSTSQKISDSTTSFINTEYVDLKNKNKLEEKKSLGKNSIIIFFIVLVVIILVIIGIYYRNHKLVLNSLNNDLREVKKNYSELQNSKKAENNLTKSEKDSEGETEQQSIMTEATEQKLLAKLEKFENSVLFTKNTVSLPYLAAYCDTNTKYLSYIINNFKHKDFNNYINELRINYIIEKIKTESKYQKYKISSLAEEAGFSSQSKFTVAFKKITNMSPSHFLQTLKDREI
ncbi:helix-turn-helix domain-containing protein [Chryseobacterium sp. RLHN22]|uniref:helix-turn-helix domain-containing protein n=1 Tax=Chryseobacterium sp. RLHN22 TaxID=3437885 RepID=UPI003D9B3367